MKTIQAALDEYLAMVKDARRPQTWKTYTVAARFLVSVLRDHELDPEQAPLSELHEKAVEWLIAALRDHAAATEQLYIQMLLNFFEFLLASDYAAPNLHRVRLIIRQRARQPGVRLPQFPRESIDVLLEYIEQYAPSPTPPGEDDLPALTEYLRALRDRAFLLTLADTGLRVHEACRLVRSDVFWHESYARTVGKGNKEAIVRISTRALRALTDYLRARAVLDGASGRPLGALPVFARHDRGAGRKVKPMTPTTGRNIVEQRVREALGPEAVGSITPHSLRHYFVTTVLKASGNLKLAQELARHTNIAVTQRYAHLSNDELDKSYHEIFNTDEA